MRVDPWYEQRNEREDNATFATARRWRRCPYEPCDGTGQVLVLVGTRYNPPEYGDCRFCLGTARVDQKDHDAAIEQNRRDDAYEDQVREYTRQRSAIWRSLEDSDLAGDVS